MTKKFLTSVAAGALFLGAALAPAAYAQDTNQPAAGQTQTMQQQPGMTGDEATGTTPGDTAANPTTPATEDTAQTPATTPSEDTAQAPAAGGDYLTAQSPEQISANTYIGQSVYNSADESIGKISDLIMEKRGLILIVGSTGSGKSTTIASMLDHRNASRSGHILTIEDPIEFLFKHKKSIVNQREIGMDTQDWASALKNAMRQAPDCILIGEIRDKETMQAAIAYAQTGHLCLATLHANNSYHALNRIINFFPLESRTSLYLDLSVSLRAIISQRLVRKPDGKRIPTSEVLLNTRHIAELVERGELNTIKEAMEQSLAQGSQTFEQALYRLHHENIITLDEALANADSPSNLHWLINNAQMPSDPMLTVNGNSSITGFEATNTDGATFQEFTLDLNNN